MKLFAALPLGFFLATASIQSQAEYYSVCESWAKKRDGSFFNDYEQVTRDYGTALRDQRLWAEQLAEFEWENAEFKLKRDELVDFLLLGISLTTETLRLSMSFSGVKAPRNLDLDELTKLEQRVKLANSKSVEEAAYRLVGKRSNAIKRAFGSLNIIKSLLDAKDRFKDRKETIKLVQKTGKRLRWNLQNAEREYQRASKMMIDRNEFKNAMDGACQQLGEDARGCISLDGTHESFLGIAHQVRNACGRPVLYFWCYEGTSEKHDRPCGGAFYYRSHKVMQPDDTFANYLSAPVSLPLKYGACYGGYKTAIFDGVGGYFCRDMSKRKR